MNVNSADYKSKEVKKSIFNLKPIRRDGLILQIHHTVQDRGKLRRIRFLYTAFDNSGLLVANADISGNIFIVDFSCNKFWLLTNFNSCSVVSFSNLNSNEIIVGTNDGGLFVLNIHLGEIIGFLEGHKYPVKHVSFANEHCLTASVYEAIIYDLKTYTKMHELTLVYQTVLKQVTFMPITNDVLICFCDDFIHVWKYKTFESYKQILPKEWKKMSLRSIAITRNGTSMVLAGHSSSLIVFSLDSWQITRILNLPPGINSVKSISFISHHHDGGANKFLVILSNDGVIYFLDMENSFVVGKIHRDVEIISFTCSPNGVHLACVLHSGEVNVYKAQQYIERISVTKADPATAVQRGKLRLYLPAPKQPKDNLDLAKLQGILKEYGEYPESYRSLIWAKILQLPNNQHCYASLINNGYSAHVQQLDRNYPLKSTTVVKNMKRLLSNLIAWNSVFSHVKFIPLFVFPFLKVFENEPVQCFETVITIILNWCQYWFQYIPKPPINVLSMTESVLREHDPQLLLYLVSREVTTLVYAWPLLEGAFSEVLNNKEWAALWDNVLSNEPAFLLMLVAAYNILFRSHLLSMKTLEEFDVFYHNQNPINVRKLIGKAHYLLCNTSERNHPRQYLKGFVKLPNGSYPVFEGYPKIGVECEDTSVKHVRETEDRLRKLEEEVSRYKVSEEEREHDMQRREEEARRLAELEDLYQEKMLKERERLENQRLQLSRLRTSLHEKQAESLELSRKRIEEMNLKERQRELNKMLKDIDEGQMQADLEVQKTEEELSKHYVELLKQKEQLDGLLLASKTDGSLLFRHSRSVDEHRQRLNNELDAIRRSIHETRITNRVNVPATISALNEQLQELDLTAAKQMAQKQQRLMQQATSVKIMKMENDTTTLEHDVQRLLNKLTKVRMNESTEVMCQLNNSARERIEIIENDRQFFARILKATKYVLRQECSAIGMEQLVFYKCMYRCGNPGSAC